MPYFHDAASMSRDRGYSIFHSSGSARLIDSYSADTPGASSDNSVTTSTELGKVSEPDAKSFRDDVIDGRPKAISIPFRAI